MGLRDFILWGLEEEAHMNQLFIQLTTIQYLQETTFNYPTCCKLSCQERKLITLKDAFEFYRPQNPDVLSGDLFYTFDITSPKPFIFQNKEANLSHLQYYFKRLNVLTF